MFEGDVKYISRQWNYMYGFTAYEPSFVNSVSPMYRDEYIKAKEDPYIIHFTSPRKPWNYPYAEYAYKFWEYAKESPYFAEILMDNIKSSPAKKSNNLKKHKIKLFNFIPLVKVRRKAEVIEAYLFNIIPILKIIDRPDKMKIKLFGFIPLLKIRHN